MERDCSWRPNRRRRRRRRRREVAAGVRKEKTTKNKLTSQEKSISRKEGIDYNTIFRRGKEDHLVKVSVQILYCSVTVLHK